LKKVCELKNKDYLCIPVRERRVEKFFHNKIFLKKVAKKFADSKKVITFAIPFEQRVWPSADEAGFFSAKIEKSSLKRLSR